MARRWTLHAGGGVSQVINFRSLRSTARTSAAPSAGSRNLVCLCVHATAEHTIAMVRAPRGRRSAVSSSIQTRLRTAWSPFKPVNCRHRGLLHFSAEKSHHAHDWQNRAMVRSPLTACGAHSRSGRASGATKHGQLVVRVWQRRAHRFPPATGYRNSVGTDLCALCRRGVEQPAGPESRYRAWLVHPRHAWMGIEFHGRHCSDSHGAGIPLWRLQISPRTHLDYRRLPNADDYGTGVQRTGTAVRPRRLLGLGNRSLDRQPRSHSRSRNCEIDAGWSDHSWRDSVAILCTARLRDSRTADRFCRSPSSYGDQAGDQRMADAWPHRETSDLRSGISRTN